MNCNIYQQLVETAIKFNIRILIPVLLPKSFRIAAAPFNSGPLSGGWIGNWVNGTRIGSHLSYLNELSIGFTFVQFNGSILKICFQKQ